MPDPRALSMIEQAVRFQQTRRDYAACHPAWLKVSGARVTHAFFDGSDTPVCGVRPVRANGNRSQWFAPRPYSYRLHHHGECQRRAGRLTGERLAALFRRQREEYERGHTG